MVLFFAQPKFLAYLCTQKTHLNPPCEGGRSHPDGYFSPLTGELEGSYQLRNTFKEECR